MNYKSLIANKISLDGVSSGEIYDSLVLTENLEHGDFSLPCFKFSKALRLAPLAIADKVRADFKLDKYVESVEVINGYVNFKLNRQNFVMAAIKEADKKGTDLKPFKANKKTICIDYSSINIAKPFHIGHLLTTAIGGSLYRIYKYLGYSVVGINHLGDWGTQFGKLIVAYKKWGSKEKIEKGGVSALTEIYVKFHDEAKTDKDLETQARSYFKKIEDGDKESLELFEWFKKITMQEVEGVYKQLGIKFDSYNGEAFYNDKMDAVIQELKAKNLLTQSEGASVVDLEAHGMPPCLILKSDGASLYATRDLAAALYRKKHYNFDKNLYVVAYQQNLHFKQFFKVLELMGHDWAKDCVHVPFGMVSLEGGGSLSTRGGNVVYLNDVLKTAIDKTKNIIKEKNPDLKDGDKVASQVGVGAVIFMALNSSRIKDLVFSFDRALNFDGETAPYIQYTHARCFSILQRAGDGAAGNEKLKIKNEKCRTDNESKIVLTENVGAGIDRPPSKTQANANNNPVGVGIDRPQADNLTDNEGFAILKLINRFDDIVTQSAEKYEPSILAKYLIDLSQSFNHYYTTHKILGDANRLKLTELVRNTLKNGLSLLLIDAPNKM